MNTLLLGVFPDRVDICDTYYIHAEHSKPRKGLRNSTLLRDHTLIHELSDLGTQDSEAPSRSPVTEDSASELETP